MRKNAGILRAEARIELRGGGTERLLNACAEAGLPLRDISFSENSCLHATLRQSDLHSGAVSMRNEDARAVGRRREAASRTLAARRVCGGLRRAARALFAVHLGF